MLIIMDRSMTATLKYALTSYKKMWLIVKLVKNKKVSDALSILSFANNKAAKILLKVIKSALSNAKNKYWDVNESSYEIQRIDVWRWPKLKRMRFVWRARIHWYQKHRTFVRVVIG